MSYTEKTNHYIYVQVKLNDMVAAAAYISSENHSVSENTKQRHFDFN